MTLAPFWPHSQGMGRPAKKPEKQGWGEGSVRQRGDRWQVRWRENGERMSLSGFESRAEALEELGRVRARLELGQSGKPAAPAIAKPERTALISKLVDDWVQYRIKHKVKTATEERSRWNLHLEQPLRGKTLTDVTPKFVRELAEELVNPTPGQKGPDGKKKEPVSGPTAHRALTLLSSFYAWAVGEELTTINPVRVALRDKNTKRLLASEHSKEDIPTLDSWEQVDQLYRALQPPVSIAYLLCARAGLRPGEAIGLQWGDVDLKKGVLRVGRQVRFGKVGTPKSGKPRPVPLSPFLAAELASWRERNVTAAATDLVCPPPRRRRKNGTLATPIGRYLGDKSIEQGLAAAFTQTGIKPATLYAYGRHTFGTLAALGGLPAWRLQEVMGHADIKTTLRYVSLRDKALKPDELRALGG